MANGNVSRRDFLRFTGVGAFALLGSRLDAFGRRASPFLAAPGWPAAFTAQMDMEPFVPDAELSHSQREMGADFARRTDARMEL